MSAFSRADPSAIALRSASATEVRGPKYAPYVTVSLPLLSSE